MSTSESPAPAGRRHVYTWAQNGSLGSPGFQTIVVDGGLEQRGMRPKLEAVVAHFDPSIHSPDSQIHQVLPIPGIRDACALTIFTPLGLVGDDRRGNFLAETVVVSPAWLGAAEWDVDVAFRSLAWPGKAWLQESATGVRRVDTETLAQVGAGSLDRLSGLLQAIPPAIFVALVAALALVDDRHLFLREAADSPPKQLSRLVLLLPLCLPPRLRRRLREGQPQPLALRTRGGYDNRPKVRLQGLAADARGNLPDGGLLFDLGGGYPPRISEAPALEYARWLRERIEAKDWERIGKHYSRTSANPSLDPLADLPMPATSAQAVDPPSPSTFSAEVEESPQVQDELVFEPPPELPEPAWDTEVPAATEPARAPAQELTETPVVVQRQREVWQQRKILEHEGWKVAQDLEKQTQQLVDTLRAQLEESQRQAYSAMQGLQEQMEQRLKTAQRTLEEEKKAIQTYPQEVERILKDQGRRLGEERTRFFGKLAAEEKKAIAEERKAFEIFQEEAKRSFEKELERLRLEHRRFVQELKGFQPPSPRTEPQYPEWKQTSGVSQNALSTEQENEGTARSERDSYAYQASESQRWKKLWIRLKELATPEVARWSTVLLLSTGLAFYSAFSFGIFPFGRSIGNIRTVDQKRGDPRLEDPGMLAGDVIGHCVALSNSASASRKEELDLATACDNLLLGLALEDKTTTYGAALTQSIMVLHREEIASNQSSEICTGSIGIDNGFGDDSKTWLADLDNDCQASSESREVGKDYIAAYLQKTTGMKFTVGELGNRFIFQLTFRTPEFKAPAELADLISLRTAIDKASEKYKVFDEWQEIGGTETLIADLGPKITHRDLTWVGQIVARLPSSDTRKGFEERLGRLRTAKQD